MDISQVTFAHLMFCLATDYSRNERKDLDPMHVTREPIFRNRSATTISSFNFFLVYIFMENNDWRKSQGLRQSFKSD